MNLFDIASDVENQLAEIDRVQAVLHEVEKYFTHIIKPGTPEVNLLAYKSSHINLLLQVIIGLVCSIHSELYKAADELYNIHRQVEAIHAPRRDEKSPKQNIGQQPQKT